MCEKNLQGSKKEILLKIYYDNLKHIDKTTYNLLANKIENGINPNRQTNVCEELEQLRGLKNVLVTTADNIHCEIVSKIDNSTNSNFEVDKTSEAIGMTSVSEVNTVLENLLGIKNLEYKNVDLEDSLSIKRKWQELYATSRPPLSGGNNIITRLISDHMLRSEIKRREMEDADRKTSLENQRISNSETIKGNKYSQRNIAIASATALIAVATLAWSILASNSNPSGLPNHDHVVNVITNSGNDDKGNGGSEKDGIRLTFLEQKVREVTNEFSLFTDKVSSDIKNNSNRIADIEKLNIDARIDDNYALSTETAIAQKQLSRGIDQKIKHLASNLNTASDNMEVVAITGGRSAAAFNGDIIFRPSSINNGNINFSAISPLCDAISLNVNQRFSREYSGHNYTIEVVHIDPHLLQKNVAFVTIKRTPTKNIEL